MSYNPMIYKLMRKGSHGDPIEIGIFPFFTTAMHVADYFGTIGIETEIVGEQANWAEVMNYIDGWSDRQQAMMEHRAKVDAEVAELQAEMAE